MSLIINLKCFPKKHLLCSLGSAVSENVLFRGSNFLKNKISVRNLFVPLYVKCHASKCSVLCSSFKLPSRSISTKFLRVPPSVYSTARTFFETGGADINTNVSKDVLLYQYKNETFFAVIKYFGVSQLFVWGYLANTAYSTLKDTPIIDDGTRELRWFEKINLGENWVRNGIAIICLCMAFGLSGFAAVLSARSVKSIVLHKGGRVITINTYDFFGDGRLTVPLTMVSCSVSRTTKPQHLPLKVKGKWLYYTLDNKGTYPHPVLFDWTAGLKRKI